jgi:uncharacterized protein YjbI with pentapeptide repeats
LILILASFWVAFFFTSDNIKQYTILPSVVVLIVLAILFIATIRQGLGVGAAAVPATAAGAAAVAVAATGTGTGAAVVTGAVAGAGAAAVTGAAAVVAVAVAGAGAGAVAGPVAGAVAVAVAVAGAVAGAAAVKVAVAGAAAGAVAVAVPALGIYIAWRALAGDEKHAFVRKIAIAFAATGGTSFRNADLTDANFIEATLKSTDFRTANLTRTCFRNTEKLDRARVGNSILADTRIRELLITGNGYKKSYVGANLQGANLTDVNLRYANLKQANLSEATLHQAHLEWANLTETQALATDFTAACFTGACLEAWNIDATTMLDRVDCRFVYLLENAKRGTDDREQRPSSGEFAPGEFTKLFEEVLNTVDLIFRNGVDWKVFITAFTQVQLDNEETELTIQGIENKGDGVFVIKVSVPPDTNKEKIHSEFTQNYQLELKAVEEKYKAELKGKDDQIVIYRQQNADMWLTINKLADKPVTIEVKATAENKIGSDNIDQSRKAEISGGTVHAIGGGSLSLGDNDGTTANTIEQLPDSATNPSQEDESLSQSEDVESLRAIAEKYKAESKYKDHEIDLYREEIEQLRELNEILAKQPLSINIIQEDK